MYLLGIEFPVFVENSMMRFACIKQMEIIREASNHISDNLKAKFSLGNYKKRYSRIKRKNKTSFKINRLKHLS